MTALVLFLAALALVHRLGRATRRPLTMSRYWMATHHYHEDPDDE